MERWVSYYSYQNSETILIMPDGRMGTVPLTWLADSIAPAAPDSSGANWNSAQEHQAARHRMLLEAGGLVLDIVVSQNSYGGSAIWATHVPEDGSTTPEALRSLSDLLDRTRPARKRLERNRRSPDFNLGEEPEVVVSGAIRFHTSYDETDPDDTTPLPPDDLISALEDEADGRETKPGKQVLAGCVVPDIVVIATRAGGTSRIGCFTRGMDKAAEATFGCKGANLSEFGLPLVFDFPEYLALLAGGDVVKAVSGSRPKDGGIAVCVLSSGVLSFGMSPEGTGVAAGAMLAGAINAKAKGEDATTRHSSPSAQEALDALHTLSPDTVAAAAAKWDEETPTT